MVYELLISSSSSSTPLCGFIQKRSKQNIGVLAAGRGFQSTVHAMLDDDQSFTVSKSPDHDIIYARFSEIVCFFSACFDDDPPPFAILPMHAVDEDSVQMAIGK